MIITSVKGAAKVIAAQKSKKLLNKDILELGKEYILLFPKKDNDLIVAGIVGYSCDYKSLGLSFCRLADDQMEINPETNRITDKSNIKAWSNLSSILYTASKRRDIEMKELEANLMAEKTGKPIDRRTLSDAIEEITIAYDGAPKKGDKEAIAPTKTRLISSSINYNIATEAVLVPLNKELQPDFDNAMSVEVRLSPAKINNLASLLTNPNYNDLDDPDGFLEVKLPYTGKDRKEAAKKPYQGLEKQIRKIDQTKDENGYVDKNTRSIQGILASTTHDQQTMFSRSSIVTFAKTAKDLEAAMRRYLADEKILSTYIDFEDDFTKRHAQEILDLNCLFDKDSKQYNELIRIIEESKSGNNEESSDTEESIPAELKEVAASTSLKEVNTALEENPEINDLVGSDDEISDI